MGNNYDAIFNENYGALKQLLAQQQQAADTSKPTGIFANVDPAMLGLAQGLLSPTKTGAFGESVGLGLAGASGPLATMRKQQMDAQEKILQTRLATAKLAAEAPYWQARAAHFAGLGDAGPSLSSQSEHLNRQWQMLNNYSPEDLGMSEEEVAAAKQNVAKKMIQLEKGGLKGIATSGADGQTESPAQAGPFPKITNDARGRAKYNQLAPGSQYTDPDGNIRTKPAGTGERG